MSVKKGRPLSDNPMNTRLSIRITQSEKDEIMAFAKKHKMTLLQIVRKGIEAVKKK